MIPSGSHLLVGVSGGADSVALLHALHALQKPLDFTLSVAHLNHSIRPEAYDDECFVNSLCESLQIPCITETVDIPSLCETGPESLEMTARRARYDFFARVAKSVNADRIATAHTLNDQAETVLLRLCRGAGAVGISGIDYVSFMRGLCVIRPLLGISRAEIEAYLKESRISWREDSTNADNRYSRNWVRHELLPLLEENLNPCTKTAIARTADILSEESRFLEDMVAAKLDELTGAEGSLDAAGVAALPLALERRLIHRWLIQHSVCGSELRYDAVERIVQLASDSSGSGLVTLSSNQTVRRDYNCLSFVDTPTPKVTIPDTILTVPGTTLLSSVGLTVTATHQTGFRREQNGPIGNIPNQAAIRWNPNDPLEIHVRSWQASDRMNPLGMKGSKKLQDLFVDAKIPRQERERIPLFIINDEIVWVPGYRISRKWALDSAKQDSLLLRVQEQ